MPHAYTEDQLVEQPAMRLFAELGWSVAQPHPHLGPLPGGEEAPAWVDDTGLFGRETKGEVVLVSRLRAALERLNPALPPEAITAGVLIVRLSANLRKSLISSRLLFEWKTAYESLDD